MTKLSDYQALLFDVDNTLTGTDKQISQETIETLRQLIERDFILGVCTGKAYPILKEKVLGYFAQDALHIVSGGSQIIDSQGEVKWQKSIDQTIWQQLQAELDELGASYFIAQNDALYAHPTIKDYLIRHPFQAEVKLVSQWDSQQSVFLAGIYNLNPRILQVLEKYHDYLTVKVMDNQRTGRQYTDLTAVGVNKAVAFEKWCELTGIEPQHVIGFGDSANDVEFLDLVGFSVGMGNATDEIKAIANRVIGHANDNGLAKYLQTILSTNEL